MLVPKLFIICAVLFTTVDSAEELDSSTEYPPIPITCGQNFTSDDGEFESPRPNYPFEYPNNADCVWIITAPIFGSAIDITFAWNFNTEDGYDFLELRAGPDQNSPLITRLTGYIITPEPIHSNSRYIWAWFHSDLSNVATGFKAEFHTSGTTEEPPTSTLEPSTPSTTGCNYTFTNTWGTFNSPEFPFYYPFNSDCEWRFFAPQGFRVHITPGQQLSLEHDRECAYDYLEFRDGPNSDSPILTKICGYHEEPLAITSSSNSLYARFHSDDQINAQGFVSIYQTRQVQKLELEERKEQDSE